MAITFCPLCNTAIAFDRRVQEKTLSFGNHGKAAVLGPGDVRSADRVVVAAGDGPGDRRDVDRHPTHPHPRPDHLLGASKGAFPGGKVLSRHTGYNRSYGDNPYVGYDDVNSSPFLYRGPKDPRLRPVERVVTVSRGGEDVAYLFAVLEKVRVVNDTVGGQKIVVLFEKGVTSALDKSSIPESRDIGTAGVFERIVGGKVLTFAVAGGRITDAQTGSVRTILGTAIAGPLAGAHLVPIVHGQHFWFAWAVFWPKTRIYAP